MTKQTKNNPVEDELNAIRIKLYEQTKDMSAHEQTAFFKQMVQEGLAKHGITLRYADTPANRPVKP